MEACNHPRPTRDHGTLGCAFGAQGYKDGESDQPKKERSAFPSDADLACYEKGYATHKAWRKAGEDAAKILFGDD